MPQKIDFTSADLEALIAYLSRPEANAEIHFELPENRKNRFEEEYLQATGEAPPLTDGRIPVWVMPNSRNKFGMQARVYFDRHDGYLPDVFASLARRSRGSRCRINSKQLVFVLLENGFRAGKFEASEENIRKIEAFAAGEDIPRPDPVLGKEGEEYVLDFERKRLRENGQVELSKLVANHASRNLGYDIYSQHVENGRAIDKFIEVKTTKGTLERQIFLTRNEINFSIQNQRNFWLYRVCHFPADPQIFSLRGNLQKSMDLNPLSFVAHKSSQFSWNREG